MFFKVEKVVKIQSQAQMCVARDEKYDTEVLVLYFVFGRQLDQLQ